MKQLRPYLDAPLIAFTLIMLSAAAITSHGTWIFYSYILPWWLAYAATVVLTAGIPLLELAAVLDTDARWRYLGGMLFLLALEGCAQYMQGQSGFVANVRSQFATADGIDLATFAQQPEGRILPLLYLAALSGIVVYFGYAASVRVRDIRAKASEQPAADREQLVAEYEQVVADMGRRLAVAENKVVKSEQDNLPLRRMLVDSEQAATEHEQLRQFLERQLSEQGQLLAATEQALVKAEQAAATAVGVDLLAIAQRLRDAGDSWPVVSSLVGIPESTLRRQLAKRSMDEQAVKSNGHVVKGID